LLGNTPLAIEIETIIILNLDAATIQKLSYSRQLKNRRKFSPVKTFIYFYKAFIFKYLKKLSQRYNRFANTTLTYKKSYPFG
jgi:hypothetical protein